MLSQLPQSTISTRPGIAVGSHSPQFYGAHDEERRSIPSDTNPGSIIDHSNNDGHGKRHPHPRNVGTRPECTSALADAQTQNSLVSSNTQASHTLSDVFSRLERELNQFQSSIHTPKARAAALATVDQDLDTAKRLMLSMFTRRNQLAPISILPAEILARIFHFVAFSEEPYLLGCVLRVTHVCRWWRQIALDDSTLWTHFSTSPWSKEWIAERPSRARNAPLVIELDELMGKDTISLFASHIRVSHTRKLCFPSFRNYPRDQHPESSSTRSHRTQRPHRHVGLRCTPIQPSASKVTDLPLL